LSASCGYAQQDDDALKDKIARMLLVGFRGTELTPDNPVYGDIKNLHIGGVILFDYDVPSKSRQRNIKSPEQLKKLIDGLQQLSSAKLLVAIDEEGGKVSRLKPAYGFPRTVTAKLQGMHNDTSFTARYAAQTAATLASLGVNLNFAPCVDLDVNPDCPVIGKLERSFSSDAAIVAKHAAIWINEHAKRNILTCPKHFPGHGSATNDTHAGSADVTRSWSEAELLPYRELVKTGNVRLIMTSHVFNARLDSLYPATMSKAILTGLLREQLGFNGVIVSDDLAMGAIADHYRLDEAMEKAINAGVDMLCLSNNGKTYDPQIAAKAIDIIFRLVKTGKIPLQRIDESCQRIMNIKNGL
jgi:beta-N-acetylhexosaminidase